MINNENFFLFFAELIEEFELSVGEFDGLISNNSHKEFSVEDCLDKLSGVVKINPERIIEENKYLKGNQDKLVDKFSSPSIHHPNFSDYSQNKVTKSIYKSSPLKKNL